MVHSIAIKAKVHSRRLNLWWWMLVPPTQGMWAWNKPFVKVKHMLLLLLKTKFMVIYLILVCSRLCQCVYVWYRHTCTFMWKYVCWWTYRCVCTVCLWRYPQEFHYLSLSKRSHYQRLAGLALTIQTMLPCNSQISSLSSARIKI